MLMPGRYLPKIPDRLAISLLAAVSVLALADLRFAPRPGANVALLYPPWITEGEALLRATSAGALIVRFGGVPFVVIVHPSKSVSPFDALKFGALLVLDAQAVAGCLGVRK